MGERTGIEWTNHTWNPWRGCHKVSPGCTHCYAETLFRRRGWGPFTTLTRASPHTFNEPRTWSKKLAQTAPGVCESVFTCSLSDFFHEGADQWRDEVWDLIQSTPNLIYQILTKRPERIAAHLPKAWGDGWPNVWLGTSVESQAYASRLDLLSRVPAARHFASVEPLLGPVDLTPALFDLDWVIVGGESGHGARPMDPDWVRRVRDDCLNWGVAFFFKQWGGSSGKGDHEGAVLDGVRWTQVPPFAPR